MLIRKPVVAGMFYPEQDIDIEHYLNEVMEDVAQKIKPKSIIVPHAGYVYSGSIAAKAYSLIRDFDTYIILGPNHTGMGSELSVFDGIYEMPFGNIETDHGMIKEILSYSAYAEEDYYAHLQEHSIEVQLPFINRISHKPYSIVPIVVGTHNREKLRDLTGALCEVVKSQKKDVLIVVSSDTNHYENYDVTIKKDNIAIDNILSLDEDSLMDAVESYNISMCGASCAYCSILTSKCLSAKKASLIEHATSKEVNNDGSQVVGYASIVIQ